MFSNKNGINTERQKDLKEFQKRAGIKFKDIGLLDMALCHRSLSNEKEHFVNNNERLEFLGDSVLGMCVASYLYERLKDKKEGVLTKIKSAIVSEDSLADIAIKLNIGNYIRLGHGEELSGGREKKAILADSLEAIIGAYYLDAGFKYAYKFVIGIFSYSFESIIQNKLIYDYKSLLQELLQKTSKKIPIYELCNVTGPEHNKTFWISIKINDKTYGPVSGKSKKEAEQNVAKLAYIDINSSN